MMNIADTSCKAQQARILARLHDGPVDTVELREAYNIMQPAARIKELREAGYNIKTHLRDLYDTQGRRHSRVALYYFETATDEVA